MENVCYKSNTEKFDATDIYYHGTWKKGSWEEAAKTALAPEDNKYDVWMEVDVDSSDVYFNKKGQPLEYIMYCLAHFTAIDSNTTRMEVKVLGAKVHLGDQFIPSPPHFVNNPIYKEVKPTTIEEYKMLQLFGKGLGVLNEMPPLQL